MTSTAKFALETFLNDCKAIKFTYGRCINIDHRIYEAAYKKLNLKEAYADTKKLEVLELYPGPGISSYVFKNLYSPKKQLLMEPKPAFTKVIEEHLEKLGSIKLYKKEPYLWESFIEMTDVDKVIAIEKQSRDHIHDGFIVMGNLTDKRGEQLYMQYLQCVANKNWLQRFGLVKMLFWVPQTTAAKVLAPINSKARARCSLITDAVTSTKLIATTDSNLQLFDAKLLEEHDPVLVAHQKDDYALLEVNPREHSLDLDSWDYCVQRLMITKSTPLNDTLEVLGHGAKEFLSSRLDKNLLKMCPAAMTYEDFSTIATEFARWPFKPTVLIDFYEPMDGQ